MQKLILPINKCKMTASWKTDFYRSRFGCIHYGADLISAVYDRTVYASGAGEVVAAGWDSVVGNVVAVLYRKALNRKTGTCHDLVLRYYHLGSILVKKSQVVTKDTVLGTYGNTGMMDMGAHLHLEADKDIKYPLYSPTVLSSSFLKGRSAGANDLTMTNPLEWLHCKTSPKDNQTYTTAGDAYIRPEDRSILEIQ